MHDGVVRDVLKASQHTQDAGAEIAQTKNIMKEINFEIEFKFTRIQQNRQCELQRQPLETLLKECDQKAKESLKQA